MKRPAAFWCLPTALALTLAATSTVSAQQVVVSATTATINSGGPGFGLISHTFDQSGLSLGYDDGITDFDSYIASGVTHTRIFGGFEWFSNSGTTSASVTYDLGSSMRVSRLALWNEESSGIGSLDLWGSVNGTDFFSLALGLLPTNSTIDSDYGADVFAWAGQDMRYVRFDMSECPQAPDGSFPSCSIGEVAFARTTNTPEPASLALFAFGLVAMSAATRRQRSAA